MASASQIDGGLRAGVRLLIEIALREAGASSGPAAPGAAEPAPRQAPDLPARIEQALLAAAGGDRATYVDMYSRVCRALPRPYGKFLEGTLADFVADGRLGLGSVHLREVTDFHLAVTPEAPGAPPADPRLVARGAIYRALMANAAGAGAAGAAPPLDAAAAGGLAVRIEVSCYNAVIQRSTDADHPCRRRWEAPEFLAIYSSRVGVVVSNLDPSGAVAREHGPWAYERLVRGEIDPDAIGELEAADLCPRASASERAEIALRQKQSVAQKESSMFRCPKCRARRHTVPDTGTQMRSGDEASTFMVTCLACGVRFEGRG